MAKTVAIDYSTSDPRKIASQNRQTIAQQGDALSQADAQRANQSTAQSLQTQDYLGNIENPLAEGQGGYDASELSQIEMTPQQQQDIVTGAGISAGTNTAASVGAAQRAADAAGGNPAALGAYRARAAQQEGAQAGDAMTQARIGASNAAATRAENVGQTRIGQQNQGLQYYQGLQGQQNANALAALGRQQQTYGTETSGLNSASQTGVSASQTPSTFDKVMGGIGGALSFLDDGDVMSDDDMTPAVVGENGPEKVVDLSGQQPSPTIPSLASAPHSADYNALMNSPSGSSLGSTTPNDSSSAPQPSFWSKFGSTFKSKLMNPQAGTPSPAAPPSSSASSANSSSFGGNGSSPMSDIKSFGQGLGNVAKLFLEDGGIATGPPQGTNGVFTRPTRVNLHKNEAVVPLSYRAGAKVRPSMAELPAARSRQPYGGMRGSL